MIMLMGVGVKSDFDPSQARDAAQLGADQRHQMIPAFKGFVVGIAVVPLHNCPKLSPIDRFEEASKDAITVLHARPLSESRQPESIRFTPDWSGMLRDIVNHSPDSPAASGEREK